MQEKNSRKIHTILFQSKDVNILTNQLFKRHFCLGFNLLALHFYLFLIKYKRRQSCQKMALILKIISQN